jgi:pSer/pThr/pTyr-binding forkhead associated (FHA) protein
MIGRDASCTVELADKLVSRRHLQIVFDPTRARHFAVDVGSSNGLFVNGERIKRGAPRLLDDKDELRIGRSLIRYRESASPPPVRLHPCIKTPNPADDPASGDGPTWLAVR